jgi:hypothetical protein
MKLLTEASFDLQTVREDTASGKRMYIEGIFAQAEVINGNKRIYPLEVLRDSIDPYNEMYVKKNRALGEINHPEYPMPNPDNAAIRVTELLWEGNNVKGRALVLKTDKGRKLQDLIEDGYQGGVSTRALGELKKSKQYDGVNEVMPGLLTTAVDYVSDPSGPECWVTGINESLTDWVMDPKGSWVRKKIEEHYQRDVKDLAPKEFEAGLHRALDEFFKGLRA